MSDAAPTPAVLDYQDPSTRRRRRWMWFHLFVLPLVWAPGWLGSMKWVGDEYGATLGANLPALPLLFVLAKIPHIPNSIWTWVAVAPLPVIAMGFLMDRVRARAWAYCAIPPIFLWLVTSGVCVPGNVPPISAARMFARRWDMDAVCVAYCWSVYLTTLGAIVFTPLVRAANRMVRPIANHAVQR